jgi:hypothetical protein
VNNLCRMLQMQRLNSGDGNRGKIMLLGLQLMHRFLISYAPEVRLPGICYAEEVDAEAWRNQIGMNGIYMFKPEDEIQPLFDFKETMFSLLTSISLECDTLLAVWNILQVIVSVPNQRRQLCDANVVTFVFKPYTRTYRCYQRRKPTFKMLSRSTMGSRRVKMKLHVVF